MTGPHRYRETRPLADGGMATLSLAERDDGAVVVVKRVRPPFDHDPVYRGLFHDEGEVCARLSCEPCCPHVVRLLDRGEDELGAYLVFEHVDGTDLGVVLEARFAEGRGLDLPAFFAVALPLCDALHAAHEAAGDDGAPLGLVHRDVSPGNVLLSKGGEVKLADFGVALSRLKTEHTVAGEMKGKFAYMAPEQTRAGAVDARADVFAAGVVLWEALAGRRLFDGPTDADVVHAVREAAAPRLDELSPDVSSSLAAVVARMLEKDPDARPSTLREVREALYEEACSLCLERGLGAHVTRLAHAHPRKEPDEHPHVQELRRRTQRVLQASPAVVGNPSRSRLPLVLGLALIVIVAATAAALFPREVTATNEALSTTVEASNDEDRSSNDQLSADHSSAPRASIDRSSTSIDEKKPRTDDEEPKTEEPKTEEPKTEKPKTEEPKTEKRQVDATKIDRSRSEPRAPVSKGFGTLMLDSDPWANVVIDGEPLGQHTPLLGLRLPAGRHSVTLENPVYRLKRTIHVDIRPRAETRRFVDLTKR